jgi:hypothetical protein
VGRGIGGRGTGKGHEKENMTQSFSFHLLENMYERTEDFMKPKGKY